QSFAFTKRQRSSDKIARVTRIGFPVDVVVIHGPNHVTIHERCIDRICLEAGNKCSGFAIAAAHGAMMLEQNFGILLLAPTQRTADELEPKKFRGVNGLW